MKMMVYTARFPRACALFFSLRNFFLLEKRQFIVKKIPFEVYVHHNYHFLPLYSMLETEEPSSLFGGGRRLWLRKEPQSWRKHIATHTSLDTQPCKDSWNLKKEKKNHGASAWLIVIAPLRKNQVEKKRTGLEKKSATGQQEVDDVLCRARYYSCPSLCARNRLRAISLTCV